MPSKQVVAWTCGAVTFDDEVRIGSTQQDDAAPLRVRLEIDSTDTPVLQLSFVNREVVNGLRATRTLSIQLDNPLSTEITTGPLYDSEHRDLASGVEQFWVKMMGNSLPPPTTAKRNKFTSGKYTRKDTEYHFIDIRIEGIRGQLRWSGADYASLSETARAYADDVEKQRSVSCLILLDVSDQKNSPNLAESVQKCREIDAKKEREIERARASTISLPAHPTPPARENNDDKGARVKAGTAEENVRQAKEEQMALMGKVQIHLGDENTDLDERLDQAIKMLQQAKEKQQQRKQLEKEAEEKRKAEVREETPNDDFYIDEDGQIQLK